MGFSLFRNTPNRYSLHAKLRGHSGGIFKLRPTEDGRLLASGGTDGTKVWDLKTMRELESPKSPVVRGASTAFVWIKREDDLSEALLYGTQNGYLGLAAFEESYCIHVVNPAEITDLAFDAPSNRLAVCHRGGVVQVYTVSADMTLQPVFTQQLNNFTPRAIAFGPMWGNERDIVVFGLYGGHVYTFRGNNGNTTGQTWNVGAHIGDIALDNRKNVLCMDDPSSGTNLYRLDDHTRVKTFSVPVTKQSRLRQVALLEECKYVVSGSDHGIVYVFDRRSGNIIEVLRVDAREWVQTVAGGECSGVSAIFAAKSRDLVGTNEIFVWRKKSKQRFAIVGIAWGMLIFLQLFVVAAGLTFMYQNAFITPHVAAIVLAALKARCYFARSQQEMSFRNTPSHGSSHSSQSTHHLCPRCGMCPICNSIAPTPPATMVVHAPPAPAPVDERIIQFLFTLFVLETHLSGDWHHLILPYAACILIFFPCLIKSLLAFFH
ncbi:WD40-repeat-containing domain protein [Mycena metata]|uniref:WD40-repeat-containing domain protein n=1 Tax=Mycena metata TaxID=1033252 RepID=A0AAD7NID6_9AGAR|nr:WD40-repeat-containing domain protein [Mycena metata]